jgi:hypothetical protein
LAPAPRRGPRPYAGGQFGDPEWVPDPAKGEQAKRATKAGPPAGLVPDEVGQRRRAKGPVTESADPAEPAVPPAPAPTAGRRPLLQLGGGPDMSDGGGFLLGLLAYTLTLAYLRNGPAGVIGWFKAKFINEPNPGLSSDGYGGARPPSDRTPVNG